MAQPTPADSSSEMRPIEDQLRECFGRVVYAHKAHEKTADLLVKRLGRIKIAQIVLSAVITAGLVKTLIGTPNEDKSAAVVAALLSTVLLAVNAYTKDVDLGQTAERHKETAARLWAVRESYLSVLTDLRSKTVTVAEARERRDQLQGKLEEIYATAPRTLDAAYKKAGIALKEREELTFSDQEIDKFLPASLRRAAGKGPDA